MYIQQWLYSSLLTTWLLLVAHEENGWEHCAACNYEHSGLVLYGKFLKLELGPTEMKGIIIHTPVH